MAAHTVQNVVHQQKEFAVNVKLFLMILMNTALIVVPNILIQLVPSAFRILLRMNR